MVAPPSGVQHAIASGEHRAVVTEIGATLRSYTVGGEDVVDGFDADEIATAGRGQVLAPWPNRLEDGVYMFEAHEGRAALDEPERGNAIHGLVRWMPWVVAAKTDSSVTMSCVVYPQPAYPWQLELEIEYRLTPAGLTVSTSATNRSDGPAPFGLGFHPYLTVGTASIDAAQLTIPASHRLMTDERALPVGEAALEGTDLNFRVPRVIGSTQMDSCFASLARDEAGRAFVVLENPEDGRRVGVWMDRSFDYVMVYTGDTLEPAARRRLGVAIEPMTCPPNALRSGTDLIRLAPGEPWSAEWGIET